MFLNQISKTRKYLKKEEEFAYYQIASEELESNNKHPGVWAKAMAEAEGFEAKAKAIYIKERVVLLASEAQSLLELQVDAKKAQQLQDRIKINRQLENQKELDKNHNAIAAANLCKDDADLYPINNFIALIIFAVGLFIFLAVIT